MSFESMISIEEKIGTASIAGLTVGTSILTTEGELPVQFLAPGDRVITRSGARELTSIDVHVLRGAEVVRVSAAALGHDRPEADIFLAPSQTVTLRDWRARALYGKAVATVEARRLVDGEYIRLETVAEVRIFTLRFQREEVIYAAGLELICAGAAA